MISGQVRDAIRHLYEHSAESDPADCHACRVVLAFISEGCERKLQALIHRYPAGNAPSLEGGTFVDYSTRVRAATIFTPISPFRPL